MIERSQGPLGRLDIPLQWDRKPPEGELRRPERPRPPALPARWSRARLWTAALADLGVVLLSVAAAYGLAAALGASLTPVQLLAGGTAGILVAVTLGVGSLWGWRATPGMALLRLRFDAPLALGQAHGAWGGWLLALAAAGLPLLLGRRGNTVAERLGGSEIVLE